MTRDNLLKRNMKKPEDCVFCSCHETVCHLFFECVVAKEIWSAATILLERPLGAHLESIASLWVAGKPLDHVNTICSAILWAIWKHRNNMIFNGVPWISVKQIWWMTLNFIRKWRLIFKELMLPQMEIFEERLLLLIKRSLLLKWGWCWWTYRQLSSRIAVGCLSLQLLSPPRQALSPLLTSVSWRHHSVCRSKKEWIMGVCLWSTRVFGPSLCFLPRLLMLELLICAVYELPFSKGLWYLGCFWLL